LYHRNQKSVFNLELTYPNFFQDYFSEYIFFSFMNKSQEKLKVGGSEENVFGGTKIRSDLIRFTSF